MMKNLAGMFVSEWAVGCLFFGIIAHQAAASECVQPDVLSGMDLRHAGRHEGRRMELADACETWGGRLWSPSVALAADLMEEGSWADALRESERVLNREPANQTAHFFSAAAQIRLGRNLSDALSTVEEMAGRSDSIPVREVAALEAARLRIASGDWNRARKWLEYVFLNSSDHKLVLKSGCTLSLLLHQHPELMSGDATIQRRLLEDEPQWDAKLREECALPRPVRYWSLFALPGEAIVKFYRSCISPAIGSRCSIEPSCSQYFLEASRKHGLVAFPLIADRLIREPSVVAERRVMVTVGSRRRIADPLSDHDAWLSDSPRTKRPQP